MRPCCTDSLSKYLQGKNIHMITGKKTADATMETLAKCRNEESFQMAWCRAEILLQMIKTEMNGTRFSFKDATAPRCRQPLHRLQALIGEQFGGELTITTKHRKSLLCHSKLSDFLEPDI